MSTYYSCQLCYGEMFKWQSDLYKHCATKHFYDELTNELDLGPEPPFQCPKCPFKEQMIRPLLIHYGLVHRAVIRLYEAQTNTQQPRLGWQGTSLKSNMLPVPMCYR